MSEGREESRWLEGTQDPVEIELRKALGEARLRGPDDVALRRMWAHVAEGAEGHEIAGRRRRAPRWLWFASGMATTAAVFTVVLSMWFGPRAGAPLATSGGAGLVFHSHANSPVGSMVVAPGRVRTGEGESLRLTLRGGTEAVLGSSSVMDLDAESRPSVERGEVAFKVPHQPFGHRYEVHAGPYRVIVVGTKFRLGVDGAEDQRRVSVAVEEGVVEVWDRTRLARLQRGETWTSPETPAALEGDAEGEGDGLGSQPATAAAAPADHEVRHAARVHRGAHARTVALASPAAPVIAAPEPAEPLVASPGPSLAPVVPVDPTEQAHEALSAGDVTRALSLFRGLVQKGGAAGENAEYETGKILRDRLRDPANALATWRHYRAEHPSGILRVETDVSIIETLVHTGETDVALGEAVEFLRRYPESERRAEIARIAGDLFRSRGDCRSAVSAYQTALSSPRPAAVAEAATYHRAACLIKLGDATGPAAAREYLRAFPSGRFRTEAAELAAVTTSSESGGAPRP